MNQKNQEKTDILANLRQQIQGLETKRLLRIANSRTGIDEIDRSLPRGSLPMAAIHEFISVGAEDTAATSGFMTALVSRIAGDGGVVVWIVKTLNVFPPSLKMFGVDPDRIIFIELPKADDALFGMEEALRCEGLVAVVCEVADPDLTATRRLQIAVEKSGVTGFLLRVNPKKTGSTACVTRWQISSLPSHLDGKLPGVGFPRWNVELLKARNGQPGIWPVEWRSNAFHLIEAEQQKPNTYRPALAIAG